jgi:excinuclease UvrABC nuclease subunit
MKKTRFTPPYDSKGKTNFRFAEKKSGVYLIKSKRTNKIVYVGYSGNNLYRTMYRHFQKWTDNTQYRATFSKDKYSVRIVFSSPKRASLLEKALIKKYKPKGNADQLNSVNFLKETIPEQKALKDYEKSDEWLNIREGNAPF